MKNLMIIVSAALVFFVASANQAAAEGSWWDTGVNLLNSLSVEEKKTAANELGVGEIGEAFKEALRLGTENVVSRLGSVNGFNADSAVHIPLPVELQTVKTILAKVGMSQLVDDLELRLNRAAEAATPQAKKLFWQTITEMNFDDVKSIYEGPEDSATRYFQSRMSPSLQSGMLPIVENSLSEAGVVQAYDQVIGQYKSLPFVPDVKSNLTEYVTQKGMDGIFYYMAQEEAEIRKNPLKQTTKLLQKVFGAK